MPELTQAQLERKAESLTANGLRPDAQAVLSAVGYTPPKLDEGRALVTALKADHVAVQDAVHAQKQATRQEADTRAAAEQLLGSFSETARIVFAGDEPTLTALFLTTRYETKTGTDGQPAEQVAVRPSRGTAEVLQRWRTQLGVAASLQAEKLAVLSAAGWSADRLSAASQAVEAYASADLAQQAAFQTHQQAQIKQKDDLAALRQWYSTAAALVQARPQRRRSRRQAGVVETAGFVGPWPPPQPSPVPREACGTGEGASSLLPLSMASSSTGGTKVGFAQAGRGAARTANRSGRRTSTAIIRLRRGQ